MNLLPEMKKLNDTVGAEIAKLGGTQEDCNYWRMPVVIEGKEYHNSMSVASDILHYSRKGVGELAELWCCVTVYMEEELARKIGRNLGDYLKRITTLLPWKPFYDQDAYANHFKVYYDEGFTFKFYVNPNYPEGYFENHVVDSTKDSNYLWEVLTTKAKKGWKDIIKLDEDYGEWFVVYNKDNTCCIVEEKNKKLYKDGKPFNMEDSLLYKKIDTYGLVEKKEKISESTNIRTSI